MHISCAGAAEAYDMALELLLAAAADCGAACAPAVLRKYRCSLRVAVACLNARQQAVHALCQTAIGCTALAS